MRWLVVIAALLAAPAFGQQALQQELVLSGGLDLDRPIGDQAGFAAWLDGFRPRALAAGISPATLDAAFAGVTFDREIVEKDRRQAEFTKAIWDYLDTAVSEDRVQGGIAAMARHPDLMAAIEARYGVDPAVVVAIWGLESAYGSYRGSIPVVQALATLAYDGRRGAFFEGELLAALQIVQDGHARLADFNGSWAGASGHTQFMPTSFQRFAVDFNGDGRRDLWGDDPADALGSTAAYLAKNGWAKGAAWGLEISLPAGFDYLLADDKITKPVAGWAALGVKPVAGGDLPDHGPATVLLPAGARGPAFLIFGNFRAIETYNTADAYVIAVGHLADRIRGGAAFAATWPRDLRALTFQERIDLQQGLTDAGFSTGGVDSRIGPKTIAAVRAFQLARGLVPDGFPSLDVLARLR